MNLYDLIKKAKTVKTNVTKATRGWWFSEALHADDREEIFNKTDEFFTNKGWCFVRQSLRSFIARKNHTKIHGTIALSAGCPILKVKTDRGGWANHSRNYDLEELISIANKIPISSADKITKKTLPPFLTFHSDYLIYNGYSVSLDNQISTAQVISVVAIEDNGTISEKAAHYPDEKPWFYLDCSNNVGARFFIISDGEHSLSVIRTYSTVNEYQSKITGQTKPKRSVDLTRLTQLDREIVIKAIETYLSNITKD